MCEMFETIETHDVGPVSIDVRVWYDPAYGMSAEPLSYKFDGKASTPMRAGVSSILADQMVALIVADHYCELHLNYMLTDDPAFSGLEFENNFPVGQQEYQDMRI